MTAADPGAAFHFLEYAESYVRAEPEVLPQIIVPARALQQASEPRQNLLKRIAGELQDE